LTPPYTSNQAPPEKPASINLPIPKNVVLIAMMEAAERQQKMENQSESSGSMSMESDDEEEEYDLNGIISGMATLAGPCGTYAVKEPEGLAVTSSAPCKQSQDDEKKLDSPVESVEVEMQAPVLLKAGQTVQVVDFQDGVAKLARGTGYILASSSQLVKGECGQRILREGRHCLQI
jgi:hypothetical protein